jgi:large subunit ribosomal protein L22
MTKVVAKLNYLRIAPRKVRLVADLIRGKKVEVAKNILSFTKKKAAEPLLKLLNSALANARNNFSLDPGNLFISKILVNEGPKEKRYMPRARGRATPIEKKTSHIFLELSEIKEKNGKKNPS